MTIYPALCAQVTATFTVLSNTINEIRDSETTSRELRKLLTQLQKQESQKLNLTAALHLEKIRKASSDGAITASNQTSSAGDERTIRMVESSISSLIQRIQTCVQEINEVLEELRCTLLEHDVESKIGPTD